MYESEVSSSALFSRDASGYDDLRRRLVPCFDSFYGTALKLVQDWRNASAIDVLDIGAGTGLFSAMVSLEQPIGRLCLIDGSAEMLEQARVRFSADLPIEYRITDMAHADLGGGWDLVISALAIHHLPDEGKRDLYTRIHDALKPGGLFVNAEQVSGPNSTSDERYARIWLEEIRHLGVPEHEIEKAQQRMAYDQCASIDAQLSWLRDAGFSDVDCSFKAWCFAVLSGRA